MALHVSRSKNRVVENTNLARIIRAVLVFTVLLLVVGANLPKEIAVQVGVESNFLLAALAAIVAVWTVQHIHMLLVSLVIFLSLVANFSNFTNAPIPVNHSMAVLALIVLVGVWMAKNVSKIIALLFLTLGIGLLLPPEYTTVLHLDFGILLPLFIALLATPILIFLFSRRQRLS
ncbi:MAG: hypothetical protein H7832_06815 [Magnetococcus sp. DMHC-6]